MKSYKRTIGLLLIPALILYTFACLATPLPAHADEATISQFPPETVESEPMEPPQAEGKGVSWWWYVLGIAVIGGAVAASSGGDGGGSGDGSSPTGTIDTSW